MDDERVKLDIGEDYDQWWIHIATKLIERKLYYRSVHFEGAFLCMNEEDKVEASMLICNQVTTPFLSRVPPVDRLNEPRRLLGHLQRLHKPFRILDPPAELRVRIYDMYMQSMREENDLYHALYAGPDIFEVYELPPLTCVSRQVREETLGIFAYSARFCIALLSYLSQAGFQENSKMLRMWAEKSAMSYLRHVRTVYFDIFLQEGCGPTLTFTEQHGLKVVFETAEYGTSPYSEEEKQRLSEYIGGVEEDRRAFNLKGESIVLAMIKDPTIWECRSCVGY